MTAPATNHPPRTDLDARYGRSTVSRRRQRWIAIAGAVGVALVMIAWVVWVSGDRDQPMLASRDTGYEVISDTDTLVRYEVTVDPGTAVRCAVQAWNSDNDIVGWKIVDVPPAEERIRVFVQPLETVNRAYTGLLSRCWLP
ncbi:MAG: DUF4307-like protein [Naasia sp.]|nr:DUF4307-like protein [Naasia sp.]